jgi:hypothetical protein
MSLVDRRAAAIAEAMNVEHVDLMPVLEPSLATYYDGFHATPAGARAVAAAVRAVIVRHSVDEAGAATVAGPGPERDQACVASRAS